MIARSKIAVIAAIEPDPLPLSASRQTAKERDQLDQKGETPCLTNCMS
jgi:hypothetical protein